MKNKTDLGDLTFGALLSQLLAASRLKSYVLASHLNYDVSYISKWVTGSTLPAAKHIHPICREIAVIILDNADDAAMDELFAFFPAADRDALEAAISQSLLVAYQRSNEKKGGQTKSLLPSDENNSRTVVNPRLQQQYMRFDPSVVSSEHQFDTAGKAGLVMMVDLFALSKEDKLRIARVNEDENFVEYMSGGELHYLISLNMELADDAFDALLITYLLNNAAGFDLTMSNYKRAICPLLYVLRNYCMHLSIMLPNHRLILSDVSYDRQVVREMYDTLLSVEQSFAKPMVRSAGMEDITTGKQYVSFVISPNISLLISRMDEFLLPDDVFLELLEQTNETDSRKDEIRNIHNLFKSALNTSGIRIAILDDEIRNYALNGIINFYGTELTVTLDQRERHIKHMMTLLKNKSCPLQIRIIDRSYLKDFDKEFAPCIYLSDLLCYVRLTSGEQHSRAYIIESDDLKNIYLRFMDHLFSNLRQDNEFSAEQLLICLNMVRLLNS